MVRSQTYGFDVMHYHNFQQNDFLYIYIHPPFLLKHMGVSKNWGVSPKMDGEKNGKPYFLMDDLGVLLFLETPI